MNYRIGFTISPNIIIAADKTENFYEMEPDNYKKFLRDNITKDYQRDDIIGEEKIKREAATIASKMKLEERIEAMGMNKSFLTVKGLLYFQAKLQIDQPQHVWDGEDKQVHPGKGKQEPEDGADGRPVEVYWECTKVVQWPDK